MSTEIFRYVARTQQGDVVSGSLRAPSESDAIVDLQRRALLITSLRKRSVAFHRVAGGSRRRRAMHAFFRSFATLLGCGITIRRALTVAVANNEDRGVRETLRAVISDIEHGTTLSAALERRPQEFGAMQIAMIRAGETGGILEQILERIADVLDREHALRKKMQAALAYPMIVACAAGTLVVFLMVHVVPTFGSMFERFGVSLPPATRMLLGTAGLLRTPTAWVAFGSMLAVGGLSAAALRSSDRGRLAWDRLRLRLPYVGDLLRCASRARITRLLGVLLASGVGLLAAIEAIGKAAGGSTYERALEEIAQELRRGESLLRPLRDSTLFDPVSLALIAVGEETGALDQMLLAAARYLDVELEAGLATLAAFIEPALIGMLGFVVAGIVFSIFLPLYSLIGSIS